MDPSQSFRRPVRRKKSDEANRRAVQWRNSDKSDASEDGVVNNLQVWPLARRRLLLRLVFRADGAEDSLATDHGAVAYFSVFLALDYKPITLCNSHMTSQMALATPTSGQRAVPSLSWTLRIIISSSRSDHLHQHGRPSSAPSADKSKFVSATRTNEVTVEFLLLTSEMAAVSASAVCAERTGGRWLLIRYKSTGRGLKRFSFP